MKFFIPTLLLLPHLSTPKPLTFPLLPHHVVLSRRLRELPPSQHQTIASLYQGYGTHYVDLWVGSPTPQRQTVIVDTGSTITAFPCEGCNDCGDTYHTDGNFHYDKSKSFLKVDCDECSLGHCHGYLGEADDCHLGVTYQEGSSWTAFEAKDVVYAGGMHDSPFTMKGEDETLLSEEEEKKKEEKKKKEEEKEEEDEKEEVSMNPTLHASEYSFNLAFGCQTKLTGLFKTQLADGIMGMNSGKNAFWKQMYESGMMEKQQFSLCFNKQQVVDREGTLAGVMTMGGSDPRLWKTPMLYAKNVRTGGQFTVYVNKVHLRKGGGASATIEPDDELTTLKFDKESFNSGGVIVDSGTTDTYLNRKLAEPFKQAWKEFTGKEYDNGEKEMTTEEVLALPTVILQLRGGQEMNNVTLDTPGLSNQYTEKTPYYDVLVAIPPEHYMEYMHRTKKFTSRLFLDDHGGSVLGANTMMGHEVLFDDENHRIGFAESDCDYNQLINATKVKDKDSEDKKRHTSSIAGKSRDDANGSKTENTKHQFFDNVNAMLFVGVGFVFLVVNALVGWRYHLRLRRESLDSLTHEGEAGAGESDTTELVSLNPVV